MLQISYIRENSAQVVERLAVKNFKNTDLVDHVIKLDEDRRQTQAKLDSISAEANAAAKQINKLPKLSKRRRYRLKNK